jgi:hypothetical protein
MSERYPFPVPPKVANKIDTSYVPIWDRYPCYCDEDFYPAAINALRGWQYLFSDMIPLLKSVVEWGGLSDEEMRVHAVFTTFRMMDRDLADIIEFAETTLPLDPWIHERVKLLKQVRPDLFKGWDDTEGEELSEDDKGPCEDSTASDQPSATVIPLKRATTQQPTPANE